MRRVDFLAFLQHAHAAGHFDLVVERPIGHLVAEEQGPRPTQLDFAGTFRDLFGAAFETIGDDKQRVGDILHGFNRVRNPHARHQRLLCLLYTSRCV